MVAEVDRIEDDTSPVTWTDPLINEMVAEVERNPLLVNSPETRALPVMVVDGAFNPPATSMYPKTELALFLHSIRLAV